MSGNNRSGHWSKDYLGHLVILLLSLLIATWLPPHWTNAMKVIITVWLMAVILVISRGRYVIALWSLERHPPLSRLPTSRAVALAGQEALRDRYDRLRSRFVGLVGSGMLPGATYHEQMTFAGLLYAQHGDRLWATSLDPWSEFLRTNETYSRLMRSQGEHLPSLNQAQATTDDPTPPPRARVFILPADLFVWDLLADPSAARELVNCHLRLWRCYPRLLLVRPRGHVVDAKPEVTIWQEMNTHGEATEQNLPDICIPDFMLVDQTFVYGRIEPEMLEETIPLMRKDLTLGYSSGPTDIDCYAALFSRLWNQAIPLDRFGAEIREPDAFTVDRSVMMARTVLRNHPSTDIARLHSLLANTGDDISNFFDDAEREKRYSKFFLAEQSPNLGLAFNTRMRAAHGPCYAIDQADLKKPERFCTTWMKDDAYVSWSEAFGSHAALRRRIFVVKDWALKKDPWLSGLLMQEVVKRGVEVGLILHTSLERFAESTRGVDAADHDAEWIVIDADLSSGHPTAGPETMGVSFGSSTIKTERKNAAVTTSRNDLMCARLMNNYLKWHEKIWNDNSSGIKKLTSVSDVENFMDWLQAPQPALHDTNAVEVSQT